MTRRMLIVAASAALVLCASGGTALAQGQQVCVKPDRPLLAPDSSGLCRKGYTSTTLATQSEVASLQSDNTALKARVSALETTLSKVSYSDTGPNGLPTLKITGANLQIVSGSGSTYGTVNGLGNLIIGYDENQALSPQTGSHNLIVGYNQEFTSYGGVMGGQNNTLSGPFSTVFGVNDTASAEWSSVTGGASNTASGSSGASVSGGRGNTASGYLSSVSGGSRNNATGDQSSILGGAGNTASGFDSSVSGGSGNTASGYQSSVSGGSVNIASGYQSSILGGAGNTVSTNLGTWPAGP